MQISQLCFEKYGHLWLYTIDSDLIKDKSDSFRELVFRT